MSGGPPHHPHGRQVPAAAAPAWNHLQVPNYFPSRQPQHAHMSNDHSFLHQPTWHTPTTESMKTIPHSHLFSLEQMLSDRQFNRHAPGVDLSLTRNGSQNGDVPTSPISLSVRDTNKINSLPPGALEVQAVELTKCPSPGVKPLSPGVKPQSSSIKPASPGIKPASPGIKPASPGIKPASPGIKPASPGIKPASPGLKPSSPGLKPVNPVTMPISPSSPGLKACTLGLSTGIVSSTSVLDPTKNLKRSNKRVDSILERLNPSLDKSVTIHQPDFALLDKHISQKPIQETPEKPVVVDNLVAAVEKPVLLEKSESQDSNPSLSEKTVPESITSALSERIEEKPAIPEKEIPSEKTETQDKTVLSEQSTPVTETVPATSQSVIIQPSVSSHDENSNSSSIVNALTPVNPKEDDVLSPCSNEDSLDSTKSRRKRKPSKTVRVSKEEERAIDSDTELTKALEDSITDTRPSSEPDIASKDKEEEIKVEDLLLKEENKILDRRPSLDDEGLRPAKTRRKTSSESETIDNIAAMVQEVIEEKKFRNNEDLKKEEESKDKETIPKPVTVSVIKTKENLQETLTLDAPKETPEEPSVVEVPTTKVTTLVTPAQKKAANTHFVEVENKLEEMFAGIEDNVDPLDTDPIDLGDDSKMEDDSLLKLDDSVASTSQDVTSTSNDTSINKTPQKKTNKKAKVKTAIKKSPDSMTETSPKKKKSNKKAKLNEKQTVKGSGIKPKSKKAMVAKQVTSKLETVKDIYAYDSGSNASSNKSKGPFIHIRGPRDSPISVNVINTPTNEDDPEKKLNKTKKYHDDSEYRHKVRSKGLHSSTLSNKYDAQTRDVSWICAFCKRGPHGSHLSEPSQRSFEIALGDLFGPYFIGTSCPEFERKLDDPYDKQFKSKKIAKMIDLTSQSVKVTGKKVKRKLSDSLESRSDNSDIYLGITDTENDTYEVWAHEDCIVWCPGVYLVGSKIVGLEEAIWTSCNVLCSKCNLKGANICCLNRGCTKVLHYCCAKTSDWQLDEHNFRAYCSIHKTAP